MAIIQPTTTRPPIGKRLNGASSVPRDSKQRAVKRSTLLITRYNLDESPENDADRKKVNPESLHTV